MTPAATDVQLHHMAQKLRAHSLRMTTAAGSGHPSTCCSMAEIMAVLFFDQMEFDPSQPTAKDVDQFVLSKGHAAPILWAALSEAGAIHDDLMSLRKIDSVLEGHPTPRCPWVRFATGSLGQGLSAACGIAMAQRLEKISQQVFVVLGDGESAEGSVWEAAQFAGHYRLSTLCAVVDLNRLGQSGGSYFDHDAEGLAARFCSFGWNALCVDGHDIGALRTAFAAARALTTMPTVLVAKTLKGRGVHLFEGKDGWHGKVLPKEHLDNALAALGDTAMTLAPRRKSGTKPTRRAPLDAKKLEPLRYEKGERVETRRAYGNALVRLSKVLPQLIALDADTKNSTFSENLLKANPERFIECFIAEQNMVGVALGLASMGWIPCASTFACFLSRAYDFLRMGVISQPPHAIFSGSHVGVSIGEDGPSQMGLEDIAMMRALVQSTVVYPCDAVSTERLMESLVQTTGISYIRTSRPKTPVLYDTSEQFPIGGSKVLRQSQDDCCTVIAAGVTLHEALAAYDTLKAQGTSVRVIDAYSIKPLDVVTLQQAAHETTQIITVEDHSVCGGLGEAVCQAVSGLAPVTLLGVRDIPRSGTPGELLAQHGLDAAAIVAAVGQLISRNIS